MRIDKYLDELVGEDNDTQPLPTNQDDINRMVDAITVKVTNAMNKRFSDIETTILKKGAGETAEGEGNENNNKGKQRVNKERTVSSHIVAENGIKTSKS